MKATERLYLTADKTRVVGEGALDAATLYAAVGDDIPDAAAARFAIVGGKARKPGDDKRLKEARSDKVATGTQGKGGDDKDLSPNGAQGVPSGFGSGGAAADVPADADDPATDDDRKPKSGGLTVTKRPRRK